MSGNVLGRQRVRMLPGECFGHEKSGQKGLVRNVLFCPDLSGFWPLSLFYRGRRTLRVRARGDRGAIASLLAEHQCGIKGKQPLKRIIHSRQRTDSGSRLFPALGAALARRVSPGRTFRWRPGSHARPAGALPCGVPWFGAGLSAQRRPGAILAPGRFVPARSRGPGCPALKRQRRGPPGAPPKDCRRTPR